MHSLWPTIFQHRVKEFPNLCKLVSVIMSISSSNATVERGFSDLTNLLTDRRLSLNNSSMEIMLLIEINDYSWNQLEKEEIMTEASSKYLEKRRKVKVMTAQDDPPVACSSGTHSGSTDESDGEQAVSEYSSCCSESEPEDEKMGEPEEMTD